MLANSFCGDPDSDDSSNKGYFRSFRTMHSSHMLREGARLEIVRDNLGHANIARPRLFTARAGGKSSRRSSPTHAMPSRVRHCVECPKCLTRYLPGFSPYRNGSYLMPLAEGFADEWTLYCACGRPPSSSRWSWRDLKLYAVSNQAHDRGYGPPEEIVPVDKTSRFSG
jgi:hypothetical protein